MTAPTEGAPAEVELRCYRHPDRPTGVRCSRCDRPICPQCMIPASVGFQCPECVAEGSRTTRQARTVYGGRVRPGERPGAVTQLLIAANIVVFIITAASGASLGSGGGTSRVYDRFALVPVQVAHGQWYRLITSTFLHYGVLHLAFNMWALYVVGPPLEAALGRLRFVTLYVLSGVAGALLSVGLAPIGTPAAGASGAIFGLFGALYIVARHRQLAVNGIVITIVANLVFTFAVPNIDWEGHVGGLIAGAVLATVFSRAPAGPQRNRYQVAGVLALVVVLIAGALVARHRVLTSCPHLQSSGRALFCTSAPSGPVA